MSIGGSASMAFGTVASGSTSVFADDKMKEAKDIVADFSKEAKKTPIDRIRESVLKKHGLTQEQLDQLPPEQQSAIRQEIAEAMKRTLKTAPSGTQANVLV